MLFADLSGFTRLAETRDPEDVAALIDRCLGTMAEVVYRYEGTVDKYIGDCVMALFGAPVAHEDDPERAISAAMEMRDRVLALNEELAESMPGDPTSGRAVLSLHVGINTGPVVAGSVGTDRRREYTVLGDAVNIAARLGAAAKSGEVIVGDPTYRLARHAFVFEPLGELSLKGRAGPMTAHRVVGPLSAQCSARGLEAHGLSTPLVGRDHVLQELYGVFERMLQGQTHIVSVIGEAGAGKSRLIREFFARLAADGRLEREQVAVRRAVCGSRGEQTYGVLASLFRDAYRLAPDDQPELAQQKLVTGLEALGADADAIARAAPLVAHVLGIGHDDPRLRFLDPEQLKHQLLLAAYDVVDLRTRRGPLVLMIEDLHWADAASVELLRFVIDRIGGRRLLLLLAHRPTFDAGPLVGEHSTYTPIRLAPLSAHDIQSLLETAFGASVHRIPAGLRQLIAARAGGNPLYLEEVLRSLIEAGILVREADGWACTGNLDTLSVPTTIQGLLLARLDRLPIDARRLIQEAAVLGSSFGASILQAVCSEPDRADALLDVLEKAEFVEGQEPSLSLSARGERQYRFTHALVQETAYQSLLVRRRSELHVRAAVALERVCNGRPDRLEDVEALGHHWSLSSEPLKGADYLIAAGDWARAIFANEDAARHYRRALHALTACHAAIARRQMLTAHERLGDVLGPAGHRDDALVHYQEALRLAAEDHDLPAQARLWRQIGAVYQSAGDRDRALAHYQSALAVLDGQDEHVELANVYQELGRLAFRRGDNQEAIRLAEQALTIGTRLMVAAPATRQEAAAAVAHARNTLGVARARAGALREAVEHLEHSLAVAQEHDLLAVACRAYANLGALYSTVDPARAIEVSRAGLKLASKIGDLRLQPWLYANLAGAYCTFTGQCEDQGISAAQAAIELDRQLGQLDHLAVPLIVLAQIYQCHGSPGPALRHYQEALRLAEEMGEPQLLFPCYDGLATLYLEMGDDATAEQYMLKGQQICERAGLDADSLMVLPFLG